MDTIISSSTLRNVTESTTNNASTEVYDSSNVNPCLNKQENRYAIFFIIIIVNINNYYYKKILIYLDNMFL